MSDRRTGSAIFFNIYVLLHCDSHRAKGVATSGRAIVSTTPRKTIFTTCDLAGGDMRNSTTRLNIPNESVTCGVRPSPLALYVEGNKTSSNILKF